MRILIGVLNKIGHEVISLLKKIGSETIFAINIMIHIPSPPIYLKNIALSFLEIGFYSLPVIGMTAIFTGAVLAMQTYLGFSRLNAEGAIASVVTISIIRELGPVIGGLMVAGRISSSIAAEIGTMKVTEQLDALRTLSTNPYKYLYAPKVIVGTLVMPFLVLVTDIIGIYGGFIVAVYKLGFNPDIYIQKSFDFIELYDLFSGLCKAAVFGFIITTIGCYCGQECTRGAKGVGEATINSLVYSSVLILISNYIITSVFFL